MAERLPQRLTDEVCNQLDRDGYIVLDGVCGASYASALRAEIELLMINGAMLPNKTQFATAGGPKQFSKPFIYEMDMHDPAAPRELVPEFATLHETAPLADAFRTRRPELQIVGGRDGTALKLQCNTGGGAFPMHYDNPGCHAPLVRCKVLHLAVLQGFRTSANSPA